MTEYKLVPVEPTEEMENAYTKELYAAVRRISIGKQTKGLAFKQSYKAMLAAAPEPATPAPTSVQDGQTTPAGAAPLLDDVAAMVERLRTGGESYEELLDLCTRQAADMLERLARELAAVKAENETHWRNGADFVMISLSDAEELKRLRYINSEVISSNVVGERDNIREQLSTLQAENEKLRTAMNQMESAVDRYEDNEVREYVKDKCRKATA